MINNKNLMLINLIILTSKEWGTNKWFNQFCSKTIVHRKNMSILQSRDKKVILFWISWKIVNRKKN
jgi:hypothetical protein